jgi:hypothetical protein
LRNVKRDRFSAEAVEEQDEIRGRKRLRNETKGSGQEEGHCYRYASTWPSSCVLPEGPERSSI